MQPLKILLSSYSFAPRIGGIETVSALLASEFSRRGHEVKIITETPADGSQKPELEVSRNPKAGEIIRLVRWCDVFFHNNISLRSAWPLLAVRRPCVIAHQTWISRVDRSRGWQDYAKRFLLKFATNVSISRAIAEDLPVPSTVVGNPYRDDIFRRLEGARDRDLVFLGRLVSDKGADLLIRALAMLGSMNLAPQLTIVGAGPEEKPLRNLATELGLAQQVCFVGPQSGEALAQVLNRHKILVVPSRWAEPFGIVALEGIACGCAVVGSEAGGLPEAIGPCGLTFPNGDASSLAATLRTLLTDDSLVSRLRNAAPNHVAKYTAHNVAAAYLAIFENARR